MLLNKTYWVEKITHAFQAWAKDNEGNVVIETAFIFPILVTLIMGSVDLGKALLINKKLISAAHITADLIAREESLTDDERDEFIEAGRLAMQPFSATSIGMDIAGIRFVDEEADPTVMWRDTIAMDINDGVETDAIGLGTENEGVVAVTVRYEYMPQFSSIVTGPIEMMEVAFVRGRVSSFVQRE